MAMQPQFFFFSVIYSQEEESEKYSKKKTMESRIFLQNKQTVARNVYLNPTDVNPDPSPTLKRNRKPQFPHNTALNFPIYTNPIQSRLDRRKKKPQ